MNDAVLETGKGSSTGTTGWRYIVTYKLGTRQDFRQAGSNTAVSPATDVSRAPTELLSFTCCCHSNPVLCEAWLMAGITKILPEALDQKFQFSI